MYFNPLETPILSFRDTFYLFIFVIFNVSVCVCVFVCLRGRLSIPSKGATLTLVAKVWQHWSTAGGSVSKGGSQSVIQSASESSKQALKHFANP